MSPDDSKKRDRDLEHSLRESAYPIWSSPKSPFFAAHFSAFFAKNLFDATPYPATTSDPKWSFSKNIPCNGPLDPLVLDSP
jgi:hypothetical protein